MSDKFEKWVKDNQFFATTPISGQWVASSGAVISEWNAALSSLQGEAVAKIAEQDARIKELELQLEVARKDAERYRLVRMPPVGRMNVISWDSRIGKYNDCVGHALDQAIDAAIQESKKGGVV